METLDLHLQELLPQCKLFFELSSETMAAIVSKGSQKKLTKTQDFSVGAKELGFLNVVLSGRARAEYAGFSIYKGPLELLEGRFFGSIDTVLGVGKFERIFTHSDLTLFSIHRNDLKRLLDELPDFKTQLTNLRMAIALRTAEEYQKKLSSVSGGKPSAYRIAPRFSMWERSLPIQLSNKEFRKIQNLSASGLYVAGVSPVGVGAELMFTVRTGNKNDSQVSITGLVTRIDKDGFGIALKKIEPKDKMAWEDFVLQAMSVEIAEIFQPDLSKLPIPMPASITTQNQKLLPCEILSLGAEGAILRFSVGIPQGVFQLRIDQILDSKKNITVRVNCKMMGTKGKEYLVQFIQTGAVEKDLIQQVLHRLTGEKIVLEVGAQPIVHQASTRPELIEVKNQQELNGLFIREISENKLILYSNLNHLVGEAVRIQVRLQFAPKADLYRQTDFLFSGKVLEISQGNAIVDLDSSCLATISSIKQLVSGSNRKNLERDFHKQVHYEHNREYRRFIQFFLITALLMACVWWCWSNWGTLEDVFN